MGSVLWKVSCEGEITAVSGKEKERDKSDAVATHHLIQWELWSWTGTSTFGSRGQGTKPLYPHIDQSWHEGCVRMSNFEPDGSLSPRGIPGDGPNYQPPGANAP